MHPDLAEHSQRIRKLLEIAGISAVLVVLFCLGISWAVWRTVERHYSQNLSTLVEFGKESLDTYFHTLESGLSYLAWSIYPGHGELDVARANRQLKQFKRAYPDLRILIVASADGQILTTTESSPGDKLPSLAMQPSFIRGREELLKGQTLSIGRAFLGPVSGDWVIPIRYGLRDQEGRLKYLLGAGVPATKAHGFWKNASLPSGAALGLTRDDMFVVARFPLPRNIDAESVYGKQQSGALARYLLGKDLPAAGTVDGVGSVTGEASQFIFRRLSNYPVTFYVASPRSNLWASWWETVWFLYLLTVLWIAGTLLIYRWARRREAAWERERELRVAELEGLNRELESFSYMVSHDLRAPVRVISGFSSMLANDFAAVLPDEARRLLEVVRSRAEHMGRLIDALLALSRYSRQDLSMQQVDVAALVAAVLDERAPKDGSVKLTVRELPPARADPVLLRQVFDNLIANALKFSRGAAEPAIEIGCADGAYYVRDNGAGFDMAHADKLFGVFSRLHDDREFEGTGVGLAIVRRIVERHGGDICARGEVGKGATFSFALD